MTDYNRSRIIGPNPFYIKNGHLPGVYSLARYGIHPIGVVAPIQAYPSAPEDYASRFTHSPCIAQVFDWPYASDDIGVTFDQSNLWGVRTRACYAFGSGEAEWLTAVPKTISGYNVRLRSGAYPTLDTDFLGDNPLFGPCTVSYDFFLSQDVYYRNSILWREPRELDGYGASATHTDYQWAPMNLNDKSMNLGPPTDTWYTVGTGVDPGDEIYTTASLTTGSDASWTGFDQMLPHVGFRGGKVNAGNSSSPAAPGGTIMLYIGWSDDATPSVFADITVTWSLDVTSAAATIHDIGACLAPTSSGATARKYWFAVRKYTVPPPASGGAGGIDEVKLSPRTDIPLWLTSVSGNKIAVGGTLT